MPSPGVLRLERDQPAQPNQGLIIVLRNAGGEPGPGGVADEEHRPDARVRWCRRQKIVDSEVAVGLERRSEERRVGKECRSRWARAYEKKKNRTNGAGLRE